MDRHDLINKVILIGIRFYDDKKELKEQFQTHGTVYMIDELDFIHVELNDGNIYKIPFVPKAIQPASPGVYTEKSTGIEITDPDYLMQIRLEDSKPEGIEKIKTVGFDYGWTKNG